MTSNTYGEEGLTPGEADYMQSAAYGEAGQTPEARERGARRRKIAGYLNAGYNRAASELQKTYQNSVQARLETPRAEEATDGNMPGTFPDVSIVRHGTEELILFPSYCKRHVQSSKNADLSQESLKSNGTQQDAEWWKQEWEKYEDDKAIVDVDVRGWVYTPHRGPMNRKNRFLLGVARRLSGIPEPKPSTPASGGTSPSGMTLRQRHEEREAQRDQERIAREAEEIERRGEEEAAAAARGDYTEGSKGQADSQVKDGERWHGHNAAMDSMGMRSGSEYPPGPGGLSKRSSWSLPADMGPDELKAANANLMTRIMPFLTNPLVSTPITVFFYDDKSSQSKTVMTNEAGHFNLRAALDFVPTHIRVLASENLSATEEVKITEPKGVSLISDVDDTVKHSSIGSGAREIFRNAFIRDLSDLTIDGVKEWYSKLYDMGVGFHYVSNSPWQLFPVLVTYFVTAGLPPGSYHLKQYSGMLQGIFEPVAERKKGTLERILRDFPERRFVLVGDSGEADLEVYTDIAMVNPGRIIAIFIRDVTTPIDKPFFEESYTAAVTDRKYIDKPVNRGNQSPNSSKRLPKLDLNDDPSNRPKLPARATTEVPSRTSEGPRMGKLIDLDDAPEETQSPQPLSAGSPHSTSDLERELSGKSEIASIRRKGVPPPRPAKPMKLRSNSLSTEASQTPKEDKPGGPDQDSNVQERPAESGIQAHEAHSSPTRPSAPQADTSSRSSGPNKAAHQNNPLPPEEKKPNLPPRNQQQSYISSAKQKATTVYNAMPAVSSYIPRMASATDVPKLASNDGTGDVSRGRRGVRETAAAYASSAAARVYGRGNEKRSDSQSSTDSDASSINKKADLWKRRWTRAQEILEKEGVKLKAWRVGSDVMDEAVKLVEENMKELKVEGYGEGRDAKGKTGEGGGEAKVKDLKK